MTRFYLAASAILLAVATLLAVPIREHTSDLSFEEAAMQAQMEEASPLARAAIWQYPDEAPRVFALFGQDPAFQDVLRRYGYNQIVPIISKCFSEGDSYLDASHAVASAGREILHLEMPQAPRHLSALECGSYAIELTYFAGNDFLGQYVVDGVGHAYRLPMSSVLAFTKRVMVSGLTNVERHLVLGERPSLREWASAALDATFFAAAGKIALLHRAGAVGESVSTASRLAVAKSGMLGFMRTAAPRVAKYATVAGVGYLAIKHPAVVTAGAGKIAEAIGLPPYVLQIGAWIAIFFIPAWMLANFLCLIKWLAGAMIRAMRV